MKQVCIARMIAFGQAGQASKIRDVTLTQMAARYAAAKKPAASKSSNGKPAKAKAKAKTKSKPAAAKKKSSGKRKLAKAKR